jgi:hypothetical protein
MTLKINNLVTYKKEEKLNNDKKINVLSSVLL